MTTNFPFTDPGTDIDLDFDFLPSDINSDHPDKYSSRFSFTTDQSIKILPISNNTRIRFKASESDISAFISNPNINSITGSWLCITVASTYRKLKNLQAVNWIPTGVIYHDIKISRDYFNHHLLARVLSQVVKIKGKVQDLSPLERKNLFFAGKMTIDIPLDFNFPELSKIQNQYSQKITFSARGGSGLVSDDVDQIFYGIENNHQSSLIIAVPVLYFYANLPDSELVLSHRFNALRISSRWSALYFRYKSMNGRSDMQWLKKDSRYFNGIEVSIQNVMHNMLKYGVVFFRFPTGSDSISLYVTGLPDPSSSDTSRRALYLSAMTYDGTDPQFTQQIELQQARHFQRNTATVFFELNLLEVVNANPSKFYNIDPTIVNLQSFIDVLSNVHLNLTITHAGAFAKSMEFIARAVVDYLNTPRFKANSLFKTPVPKKDAAKYTLYIGCLLFVDIYPNHPGSTDREELLEAVSEIGIDLSNFTRYAGWMDLHGDDAAGPPSSGWKSFNLPPIEVYGNTSGVGGARKTHFLVNALELERNPLFNQYTAKLADNANKGDGDEKIDILYNKAGRDFQIWLEKDFDAEQVEEKIIELVVSQSSLVQGAD